MHYVPQLRISRFGTDTMSPFIIGGNRLAHLDTTRVSFRRLDDAMIKDYLDREQVLDCAGSFKSEGLGIALVEKIETCDPTALIGLPLIWLAGALRSLGLAIL